MRGFLRGASCGTQARAAVPVSLFSDTSVTTFKALTG